MSSPNTFTNTFTEMPAVGISACLLGREVRYDGQAKNTPRIINTLGPHVRWVPVCPEVECGLPVPREPMHLIGDKTNPRMVTLDTGVDRTALLTRWAGGKLKQLQDEGICGFVFKGRSPSCAFRDARLTLSGKGRTLMSPGIFTGRVTRHFPLLPATDEQGLGSPAQMGHFLAQARMALIWRALPKGRSRQKLLARFHRDLCLVIISHSPEIFRALERLMQQGYATGQDRLMDDYANALCKAMRLKPTRAKVAGALKRSLCGIRRTRRAALSARQGIALQSAIENLRSGRSTPARAISTFRRHMQNIDPHCPAELMGLEMLYVFEHFHRCQGLRGKGRRAHNGPPRS